MAKALAEYNPLHHYEEDDEEPQEFNTTHRILNNVTLRDLQSEGGAQIQLDEEYNDDFFDMDKTYAREIKEIAHVASSKLREDRVAPRPEQSFESLESEMVPVDDRKLVMKKIITPGVGGDLPEYAKVVVDYEFYKEHDQIPFDSTFLRGRKQSFIIKPLNSEEGVNIDVIFGLFIAVRSMKKRETSKFIIKWQAAFGEKGTPPRVDPKMNILAIVTLIDFSEIVGEFDNNALNEDEVFRASFEDVINKVRNLNHEAKKFVDSQNYFKASSIYRKGISILNDLRLANDEEQRIMVDHKNRMLLNYALCYNKMNRPEPACKACQEILSHDNKNSKAFYQLAKGKFLLNNYNDCRKFLLKAKELEPKNSDINNLLKKCNDAEALRKVEHKAMYMRMIPQFSPKKRDENKSKKDDEAILTTFEKTLREALKDHFETSVDDFALPGKLTSEEIETSLKVAEEMKLNFEEGEDGIYFKIKRDNKSQ